MKFITKSEEETVELAKKIASEFVGGEIVVLEGDLGAGKTTFTKGLAEALQVTEQITSPTFVLVKGYKGRFPLYHFDMYRIENVTELDELGFDEYFYEEENICVIEWNKVTSFPRKPMLIKIERIDDNSRSIEIK